MMQAIVFGTLIFLPLYVMLGGLIGTVTNNEDKMVWYMTLWPIMIACSIFKLPINFIKSRWDKLQAKREEESKPSTIMVRMIGADLIKHPEWKFDAWERGKVAVRNKYGVEVYINEKPFYLSKYQNDLLTTYVKKSKELAVGFAAAESEKKKEMLALDYIQGKFK